MAWKSSGENGWMKLGEREVYVVVEHKRAWDEILES
jgi:hypothetical protein